jgi:two-component system nitrogen regulation response regulator GlnG
VVVAPQDTLNKVAVACERQYFEQLWLREKGDFAAMARILLGDEEHGRKVQLRFNQLGLKVRELKDRLG